MASRTDLPPALGALLDAGLALMRRAPSARIAVVRAGGVLPPEALRPDTRARVEEELAAARAAVCAELPRRDVERLLADAWGAKPGKVLDAFDPAPVALAPAAQVHRGEHDGREVAVKVRRPGVERGVRADLALLDVLAAPLRAAFPRLDAGAVLRDARELALDELDLEHEASTQRRVARALRDVDGVRAPAPVLDLCTPEVLVAAWAPGTTLADGARPGDPGAVARALVAAVRAAVLDGGVAPVDLRASHVVLDGDDVALLGMGVARPVERDRAHLAIDAFDAVARDDEAGFVAALTALELLDGDDAAREAFALARRVLGDLLAGPALLDAAVLRDLLDRAAREAGPLVRLATAAVVIRRASSASPGRVTMSTGSNAAIALAISAWSAVACSSGLPHSCSRAGHAISVRSCGANSAGMRRPSCRGVRVMAAGAWSAEAADAPPACRRRAR